MKFIQLSQTTITPNPSQVTDSLQNKGNQPEKGDPGVMTPLELHHCQVWHHDPKTACSDLNGTF
jgi:hypothetical protein